MRKSTSTSTSTSTCRKLYDIIRKYSTAAVGGVVKYIYYSYTCTVLYSTVQYRKKKSVTVKFQYCTSSLRSFPIPPPGQDKMSGKRILNPPYSIRYVLYCTVLYNDYWFYIICWTFSNVTYRTTGRSYIHHSMSAKEKRRMHCTVLFSKVQYPVPVHVRSQKDLSFSAYNMYSRTRAG